MIIPFRKQAADESGVEDIGGPEVTLARLRDFAARTAHRLGLPGAIRDMSIKDELSGQRLAVQVGAKFVKLSVDGRDYYFDRLTGRYAGTGAVVCRLFDRRSGAGG